MVKALLCSDAVEREQKEIGDPTEIALVKLGKQYGLDELNIREQYPRLAEIPFDSARKLMSTVNQMDKQSIMITKGLWMYSCQK